MATSLSHGARLSKLTVLRKVPSDKRGPKWMCGCDCGNTRYVKASQLMRGNVTACVMCMARCANTAANKGEGK